MYAETIFQLVWLEKFIPCYSFFFHHFDFFFFVVEMSTLTRENGTTTIKILEAGEVDALIKEHEQVKAEEAKQAAAKK